VCEVYGDTHIYVNKVPLDKRTKDTCLCGNAFDKYNESYSRQRYCSNECRKKYNRRGERDPKVLSMIGKQAKGRPKPNLKGYKQSEEHLIKRLGGTAIRASKEELSLIPTLSKLGYRHTGEGAFWRRWKDGTLHNPDFVNEERKEVIEYFGAYWHADDRGREDEIKAAWAEIGWDCTIIWSEDLAFAIGFGMIGK
jgi:hypothetical protein